MDLKGKVIIVTGGSRDIGREVTLKLVKAGACVAFNYFNSQSDAIATMDRVQKLNGKAISVFGDLTKFDDATRMVDETCAAFGSDIDGLVCVTGGLVARKSLNEIDEDFYRQVFDLNFKSMLLAMKAAVSKMKEGGSIVNFSSQAARDGGGGGSSIYAASKGAVSTFTKAMSKELGPKGIRVNAVCPGMINTSFHDRFTKDAIREKVASSTPLLREGSPEEVASLVAYLLSDESSFITGANIDINGGLLFS